MLGLSSREIAILIWGTGFFAFFLFKKDIIRRDAWNVVKVFKSPYIVVPVVLMTVYIVLAVIGLHFAGIWTTTVLKDTILWFLTSAVVSIRAVTTNLESKNLLFAAVKDSFKLLLVFQFLTSKYTFPIGIELLLVPTVTWLAMTHALAQTKPEHQQAANVISILQSGIFVYIIVWVIGRAVADWENLARVDTLRLLFIGPILSIALVPFLFLLRLYAVYERVFVNLKIGPEKTKTVQSYARRRIIARFGLNDKQLLAFLRSSKRRGLHRVQTKSDVDNLLAENIS